MIGIESCTQLIFVTNHTVIACDVAEGLGGPLSVDIVVDQQEVLADIFYYNGNL